MNTSPPNVRAQRGSMLLEALISILIFSIGILSIVGLQASSINMSSDAQYRSEASLLANQYVSSIWATVAAATTATVSPANAAAAGVPAGTPIPFSAGDLINYETNGSFFTAWQNSVVHQALPNGSATVVIAPVAPNPSIVDPGVAGAQQAMHATVNIKISWSLPGCNPVATNCTHNYETTALISSQKML